MDAYAGRQALQKQITLKIYLHQATSPSASTMEHHPEYWLFRALPCTDISPSQAAFMGGLLHELSATRQLKKLQVN